MKTLLPVTILLIFVGCASQNTPTPTQNKALNGVSNSTAAKKKSGWMQKNLDNWLENDWEKSTKDFDESLQKTKTASKIEEKPSKNNANLKQQDQKSLDNKKEEDSGFTLQHYVDKAAYYLEHKEKSNEPSHAEQLKKLPVIGD